jgi:hypothetical protein
MKKIHWMISILIITNLVVIIEAVIHFMNLSYPLVGQDYSLGIPWILDTYLHFHTNGLSIQWYTSSFGGGLPAFPNPNNVQFSLLGLLPFLVSPWLAVIISSIMYIALGGIVGYYLFFRVLRLHWTSSILGMIFLSANGFIMERLAVGHLGYQTFPAIAILAVLLLDPAIPKAIAGLLFSLIVAVVIQQAGYFLIIAFCLSLLIVLPLLYIYRPDIISWKRIITVIAFGGIVAVAISASKLAAVYAFMRFFPRQVADTYPTVGIPQGLVGVFLQLLGMMNLLPLVWLLRMNPEILPNMMVRITGAFYGYWEFDMSLSPVVFGIVFFAIYSFFRRPKKYSHLFTEHKKWIAWIVLLIFTWVTIEFILAKGLIYPYLRNLPVLSSLHVNPRFTVALLFPLAMIAALLYNKWISKWPSKKSTRIFLVFNVLTLIPLCTYFMVKDDLQDRLYNITESEKIYTTIRAGDTLTVTGIANNLDNTQALGSHMSNLDPYDPIFGYFLENFHPEIKPGSIWEISDGYYNMTNPSGYVFPEINGSRTFERIPVSEKSQLEAFAAHKDPDWKIPLYQQILDWMSGLTAAGVSIFLLFAAMRTLVNRIQRRNIGQIKGIEKSNILLKEKNAL